MNHLQFRVVLADDLLPVQAFFNALPDDRFLHLLDGMLDGIGIDYNGVGCVLPGEDDESAPENGILFYVGSEEKWLPDERVLKHFDAAVEAYLATHPQDKERGTSLLQKAARIWS
ncbi:ribonuclease toxin immunity protein CdiI [Asticcacaulis solisilvae]|uniref:ribonuclease toxin immunity protein CdiI n=1 Tax=Asticcacaulis solisilvae TaxID=1217274 RepID=UPI003FD7AF12